MRANDPHQHPLAYSKHHRKLASAPKWMIEPNYIGGLVPTNQLGKRKYTYTRFDLLPKTTQDEIAKRTKPIPSIMDMFDVMPPRSQQRIKGRGVPLDINMALDSPLFSATANYLGACWLLAGQRNKEHEPKTQALYVSDHRDPYYVVPYRQRYHRMYDYVGPYTPGGASLDVLTNTSHTLATRALFEAFLPPIEYVRMAWSWQNLALVIDGHLASTRAPKHNFIVRTWEDTPKSGTHLSPHAPIPNDVLGPYEVSYPAPVMLPLTTLVLPDPDGTPGDGRTVTHTGVVSTLHALSLLLRNRRWLDGGGRARLRLRGLPTDNDLAAGKLVWNSPLREEKWQRTVEEPWPPATQLANVRTDLDPSCRIACIFHGAVINGRSGCWDDPLARGEA